MAVSCRLSCASSSRRIRGTTVPEKILVTREIPESGLRLLAEFDLTVLFERPPTRDELLEAVRGASGVLSTATEKIDGEVMDAAGEDLRVVANMAVGYDNIDVEAARERGVIVTNTPGVLDETTADAAFILMLAAARRLGEGERLLRAGEWEWWGPKQLRLVGLGRIGQAVARRAKGFGMAVLYHNRSRSEEAEKELGAQYFDLDDLLRESDFVSIHTPLTDETRHMIGERELGLMRQTAVLVNTSRGPVVDEAALAEALAEGRIFAAGLDVYEEEPRVHPKLLELENAVLAPHIGSATIETRDGMATLAAENLAAVLRGGQPKTPIES
jgi:glyoxylate reductase